MKIRYDFVSNSSSSSFVLFGTEVKKNELLELQKKMPGHENDENNDFIDLSELQEFLYTVCDVSLIDYDECSIYCGSSPVMMKDNETLLQFKERIAKMLSEYGIERDAHSIKFYSGTNYDDGLSFD